LEGSTLTVTPLSPLTYGTQHTLVIPAGAVGDDYGHTMEGSYSMSFTTTASSPEIIFAYPGNGMEGIALDTEIRTQFNQSVLSGPKYGEITMYGPASEKLTASLSIEGEWMNIRPAAKLEGEKQYTLTIPKGAVVNERGEAQQEDYILEFTTAKADDNGNDEDDNDNDRDNRQEQQASQPTVKISRQTSADGSSTATIDVDGQTIAGLKAEDGVVTLDMTGEVRNDEKVRINLSADALKQLAESKSGLSIVTGKGDIYIPAELVASLLGSGEKSISITISENNEETGADGRVSSGVHDFTITAGEKPVREFASQLMVTIPLDGGKIENAKRVIACVYDEASGSWQPVGGVTDELRGTVTFGTRHFSSYAAFEKEMHFDDVTSSWAKEKVEILASRRLINGVSNTAFNPEGSITRAEFAAMLVRSLYGKLSKSKGTFADVAAGSWYADSVETAYELGLVTGISENSFGPDVKINREQLAVMAYRLYQYKKNTGTVNSFNNTYADYKDISSYAKVAAGFAAKAGIMTGSGGRFEPRRSATRQEAAVVLYRLLEYMGEL
ncbi:MAG TPA: S-layer homology domain-containing protein, partial [Bacillota bacterium]|nr:S-layer homology domain-containing protein [Bacillota bacterium]